jgi:uncharacterized Zn ribbon protein
MTTQYLTIADTRFQVGDTVVTAGALIILGGDIPRPGDGTTLPRGTTGKVVEIEDGDLVVQCEFDGLPDPIGIIEPAMALRPTP